MRKTARTTWMASSRNASGPASSFGHGASERTDSRGSIEYLKLDGVAGSGRDPRLADTRHQSVQIDILRPAAPRSFECQQENLYRDASAFALPQHAVVQ